MTTGTQRGRTALLTGITGQDGSFLAELLLERGYEVVGVIRESPDAPLGAAEHLRTQVELVVADLLDPERISRLPAEVGPDEIYHLAAPSFVPESWEHPARTMAAIAVATAALLEGVRRDRPDARVFLAASAAMFGDAPETPQHEQTSCRPRNPYAVAKLAAHQLAVRMREREDLFACSGILYNHESERRPVSFLPRKITHAAAAIKLGRAHEVALGALDSVRDWSFAGDIVRGAWLTLQQDLPDDYILASGVGHTVAELADVAFACVGLDAGEYIRVDPALVRLAETMPLVGDPTRARERLGWEPTLGFEALIERMVEADLRALSKGD
ncbi:MAG TPA: GDP-mannose 4,6-dehydratase [Solirubrobacteraceae bacterium]|nr:GDP-mannose 4,6-dehydratase [Solirubrobacteraceae bacterium]